MNIELSPVSGVSQNVLWFYMYSDTKGNILTDSEVEAVNTVFSDIFKNTKAKYAIWAWARPDSEGIWKVVTLTLCDTQTILASRENKNIRPDCQTSQSFAPMDEKHLKWYNE